MYKGSRESSGKYAFSAYMDGQYKYCFSNTMSKMTAKVVMFSMDIGDGSHKEDHADSIDQGTCFSLRSCRAGPCFEG